MPLGKCVLIHERIRGLIRSRGLKDVAVAQRVGEDKDWISNRLTGKVQLLAEELPLFAKALDVDPCVFLRDEPTTTKPDRMAASWAERAMELPEHDLQLLIDFLTYRQQQAPS